MDNDSNKKVNSTEENTSPADTAPEAPVREETERERQMRLRDEQRRKEELEAILEDVERRYTMQAEEAMSNMDSIIGKNAQVSGSDAQEVLDLEAFMDADESSSKKKKKKDSKASKPRKKKEPEFFDLDEKSGLYAWFYLLGDGVSKFFIRLLATILHYISIPLGKLRASVNAATADTKAGLNRSAKSTVREIVYFRKEIHSANKSLLASLSRPKSIPPILGHYIGKAIKRHKHLLRTAANIALPVIALIILFNVFSYWNKQTFALNVIYNDKSIGYISDESVFIEARELVMNKLSINELETEVTQASSGNLNAGYELALVSLDELSDAGTISDRMIANSVDNLTNACGVYIDGVFLCAVKNEADAKTVFYNILEPYEEDAAAQGYVVGFAEDIDYVQGLYRDDPEVMWDASKLETIVLGKEGATAVYIAPEAQSVSVIATICSVSVFDITTLNEGLAADSIIEEGQSVTVPSANRLVNIKKTVKTSRIAAIPYETITTRDATKYSGYRLVKQEGVNGTQRIITTKTYVNDILVDTGVSHEVITEATEEKVVVGTMTTFGGIYIGMASDQGFLWPAPSCHYISSPYGWRSSGWHSGVDLVTGNGTALGTPVIAARSGTVEVVQHSGSGYGNMVLINHGDGFKTRYAHMISGSITVSPGDYVDGGQTIGKVGSTGNSTGPHLHFEVIYNGETQNPVDYIK